MWYRVEALERARKVRALVLDVDGVLTDGRLHYSSRGETLKVFHSRDGFAIKLAQSRGMPVGILSGRGGSVLRRRLSELEIPPQLIVEQSREKSQGLAVLCQRLALSRGEVAYMGDDIPDLSVLCQVGLACAPADAPEEVKKVCHFVAAHSGGRGAVRDLVVFLLQAQGIWEEILEDWKHGGIVGKKNQTNGV
ncbi:MAG: KdsC family phosphatase [Thermoanaerobaculaceae bacterium]